MTTVNRIQKLDRRHGGRPIFQYLAEPIGSSNYIEKYRNLQSWREWCWEMFGPGAERDIAVSLAHSDSKYFKWGWQTDHHECRLYLTEDALTLFKLKWC